MNTFKNILSYKKEAKEISKLATPLVITQLAQVAINVTNILMIGLLLGAEDVAAGGLAIALYTLMIIFSGGMITAISNLIAFEYGKNKASTKIGDIAKAGFIIATLLAVVFYLIAWNITPLLVWSGQDPLIIPLTTEYLRIVSIGILPCLWFMVLRYFVIGLRHPGRLMVLTLIALVINIISNFILINGYLGFPALGLMGVAWSNTIIYICSFILFAISIVKNPIYKPYQIFHHILGASIADIVHVLKTGLPLALTCLAESTFFVVVALLMGRISTVALAANVIVIQCVNVAYMIAMGISIATSMSIGHAYGANDFYSMRRYAYTALMLGFVCMGTMGIIFVVFDHQILSLFIKEDTPMNTMVYTLGTQLLLIAALFQIFDGWQNISIGVLRGLKAMHTAMFIPLIGYWAIGLPLAYLMGFYFDLGATGIWWALACALAITAILFIISFEKIYRALHIKLDTMQRPDTSNN